MRFINTLREDEEVKEIYLCKQLQNLKTKAGKTYCSMHLCDKTGDLDGKIWEMNNGIEHFENMDYIQVEGKVVSFQGSLQMNIRRVRKCRESEYNPSDFVPTSTTDIEVMYKELLGFVAKIRQPQLKELLESFFVNDAAFIKKFKMSSAAKGVHHAFVGGLLEHTLGVTKTCEHFASRYTILQPDLLIAAALCHDIGKTKELSPFPENDYTEDGNLIGHIVMGAEMLGERIKTIPKFPPVLANELRHCILAHHGELEYGSPKKPALAEAIAVYFADNVDAKMETLLELFNSADNKSLSDVKGEWMGYQKLFESNIKRSMEF